AILTALACGAMAVYWGWQGGLQGRLVEVEQLPVRQAEIRVDVNTAERPELAPVTEISETLAKPIIEYRQLHRPLQRLEELEAVPVSGPRTFDRMRPFLGSPSARPESAPVSMSERGRT